MPLNPHAAACYSSQASLGFTTAKSVIACSLLSLSPEIRAKCPHQPLPKPKDHPRAHWAASHPTTPPAREPARESAYEPAREHMTCPVRALPGLRNQRTTSQRAQVVLYKSMNQHTATPSFANSNALTSCPPLATKAADATAKRSLIDALKGCWRRSQHQSLETHPWLCRLVPRENFERLCRTLDDQVG